MNCAYCGECDLVGDLMFSEEDEQQTRQLVVDVSRNNGIHRSSVGSIIRATQPEDNNEPTRLLVYCQVV